MLASPISRRRYLVGAAASACKGLAAGLSALAPYSALADPNVPVVALDRVKVKNLLDARGVQELPTSYEAELEVEVWSTSRALSQRDRRSIGSRSTSLFETTDERVRSALDEMM